jgi:hypothetical protein
MTTPRTALLAIDASINLFVGAVLLAAPAGVIDWLGLPPTRTYFYVSILGAVVFGIGIALALELYGSPRSLRGLSLGGAIAINLCGGSALAAWLIFAPLRLPTRGLIILWVVTFLVLGTGVAEIASRPWQEKDG